MDYLEKLTRLRQEKGLSIGKLTALAGLSENTIYNWYKKKRNVQPTIYALKAICDVLGVSLSHFFAVDEKEYLSAQEEKALALFSSLDEKQKGLSLELMECFVASNNSTAALKAD